MSIEAHVWVEDQHLGTFEPAYDERGNYPRSVAFFCPSCARVWARIIVGDQLWHPVSIPCRKHHCSPYLPGGSIWLPLRPELNHKLPPQALRYEMLRGLELVEQYPEEFVLP